jgi:hypothetical protein
MIECFSVARNVNSAKGNHVIKLKHSSQVIGQFGHVTASVSHDMWTVHVCSLQAETIAGDNCG